MPIPKPRTTRGTLPSVSVSLNQTRMSPAVAVPVGVTHVHAEIDQIGWPDGTTVRVNTEMSENGGTTWVPHGIITAKKADIPAGQYCAVGFRLDAPNTNANLRIRASITVIAGGPIALAGRVTTV